MVAEPAREGAGRIPAFRPDVEGLRAVAVLAVVAYHYSLGPFSGGYVGVDVFFVISGFVITRMLLAERTRTGATSLTGFYARRARRILPAGALTLVTTVVAAAVLLSPAEALRTAHDAIAAALFYANVHFAQQADSYLLSSAPASPVVHFWSLSIEEQFYVVWPGLFILVHRLARRRSAGALAGTLGAIVVGSFAYSAWVTAAHPLSAYYSSFARAGELALGALVAVGEPQLARLGRSGAVLAVAGLAGIVATAVAYGASTSYPGLFVLGPTLATAALIAGGSNGRRHPVGRVLAWRPLRYVGALSYSLYLWHWPVYALATERLGREPSLAARCGLLAVAVGLAVAVHHLVEDPVRRSARLARARRTSLALGASLVALSLVASGAAVAALSGAAAYPAPRPVASLAALSGDLERALHQTRLPPLVVPLAEVPGDVAYNGFDRGCLVAFDSPTATGSRPTDCAFGDTGSRRTLVLFGDSNADMWLPALAELGRTDRFRVVLLARASCQLADLDLWNPALHAPGTACSAFRDWAVSEVARLRPFAVVAVDYAYGREWDDHDRPVPTTTVLAGITATVSKLARSGARVVVLGPPPAMMQDPSSCLADHEDDLSACDSPVTCLSVAAQSSPACRFAPATGRTYADVDELGPAVAAGGGRAVSVTPLFCVSGGCPLVVDHVVTDSDLRHVSEHYAAFVAPALGQLLERAGLDLR